MKKNNKKRIYLSWWIAISVLVIIVFLFKTHRLNIPNFISDILSNDKIVDFPNRDLMKGAWIWKSPDEISPAEMDDIFSFAKEKNINTLFIDLSKYTDIADSDKNEEAKIKFSEAVKTFMTKAYENKIEIFALGGTPTWANSEQWYLPLSLMDYTIKFNGEFPDLAFSGIQYDVEFYNDDNYKEDETLRDSEFIMMADQLTRKVRSFNSTEQKPLKLGFVVPYWFDENKYSEIFVPLMRILNDNGGSYIFILAYRTELKGNNGTLNLIKDELDFADTNAPRVTIIVGQESDNAEEDTPSITFYGRTKRDLEKALEGIISDSISHPTFGGVAVNQLSSYKNLKD
jgi:hypothetical protein